MKRFIIVLTCLLLCSIQICAQMYINSAITPQNNITLYTDETVQQGSPA
ncbi:MAG: hypothetical protein Q8M15_08150 [Bacteroidota bacterium]|nr:hypothetical protein [Bacteroidota bacterium]